jgi:hypothetical protein
VSGPIAAPPPAAPWHALFAPLPSGARPLRRPVASPEQIAAGTAGPIAGWEALSLELSAGAAGMRVVLVTLDERGEPISASDLVLHRRERPRAPDASDADAVVEYRQETVGGRLERDGSVRATRWDTVTVETLDGDPLESAATPSAPSAAELAALRALAAEMVRRAG